ncbi:hypothetical protein A4G99_00050 [Haladaptatus sp. R4]|uniref:hypothetical protein n=1 Tax=Haladaptatus sp. R4 TaxID=1679489 RepID=UPI0007B4D3BC|nr:hypothetical protein [Haladaptatus sp. R4]KZN24980.1 hypothetical protein A4G99_00050 [Haladaptatus sp. R4]
MSAIATRGGTVRWLRGLWEYYREYTHTAIHAAATAALTAFGLLIFVNKLFVLLAIASYVFPPVILYSIGFNVEKSPSSPETGAGQTIAGANSSGTSKSDGGSTGTIRHDGDADSDGYDGDTDSDSDDGDTDSDSDDGDTDTDSDDGDTDSDGDDGDTDSDG